MIQSPRLAKKRKQERVRRLFIWPAVIIIVFLSVVGISRLKSVSITSIDITGNSVIKVEDVQLL